MTVEYILKNIPLETKYDLSKRFLNPIGQQNIVYYITSSYKD